MAARRYFGAGGCFQRMTMVRRLIPILVFLLTAAMPAAAHAYLPPGFVGISPQNSGTAKDYRLMREADVRSVRLPLFWAGIEPQNPAYTERNWEGFDREVRLAAEAELEVFPFITASPKWVAPLGIDLPVTTARQRRAWAAFVRAAVHRYGPGGAFWQGEEELPYFPIRRWEIWNEENLVTFATGPEPRRFARLIRIAGGVIHREAPGSQVILGGLFGRPLQTPPNIQPGNFLTRLYRAHRVKPYFDGIALHPYVARATAMRAEIANLRRVMRAHHDSATPLYLTELGWGSNSGQSRWERGYYGQAEELDTAFSLLSAHRLSWRIGGVWWFSWIDAYGACQFCDSAGLLTEDREAKPAWYAFNSWTGGDPDTVPRLRFSP
jgi:glycosyl hydrolase family 42 (putative beta-galactosidase)